MSVLSDKDIRWRIDAEDCSRDQIIGIDPFDDGRVQPSSVDLTLADEFQTFSDDNIGIDLAQVKEVGTKFFKKGAFALSPGELVLFSTAEYIEIPTDLCGRVEGKSSIGRLGLLIHCTAGFVDPGFKGNITLEMVNLNKVPIILRAGLPICQLSFLELTSPSEFPYGHERLGSHYQNQQGVTASRYDS